MARRVERRKEEGRETNQLVVDKLLPSARSYRCGKGRPEEERKVDLGLFRNGRAKERNEANQQTASLSLLNLNPPNPQTQLTMTPYSTQKLPFRLPPPSTMLERPPPLRTPAPVLLVLQPLRPHPSSLLLHLPFRQLPHSQTQERIRRRPVSSRFGEVGLEEGASFA